MRTIRNASSIICLICLGAASNISWAAASPDTTPSFNCTAPSLSVTEQQICGDAELAQYDRELTGIYQAKIQGASSQEEKTQFLQSQRAWLQKRNACGGSLDCIKGAYLTKIYDLQTSAVPASAPGPAAAGGNQAAQVNAAIPLSGSAQTALSEAQRRVGDKVMLDGIQSQLALKMQLRALNCVQTLGIAPGLSSQQLHDNYGGSPCFAKQDDDIAKWLGMRTVGYLLSLPPLRPVPATAPQSITDTEGNIMSAHIATQAGIAVLQSSQDVEVIDIARDTPINSRLRQDDGPLTGVSPNGRIYVTTNRGLRFYSSVDGTLLADSGLGEYATICGLPWLDPQTILTRDPNSFGTSAIYDFTSGSFTPMDSGLANVNCIVSAPGAGDTSVAFGNLVSKFRLVHGSDGKPHIDVLQVKQTNLFISRKNDGLAAGGRQFIYVTKDQLGITDLVDLSTQTIDFGNYTVQDVWPTTDPDRIIVRGVMKHRAVANSDPAPLYEYAIREQTMSLVDTSILGSKLFLYYPQQNALYVMRNSSLTRVDGLQMGSPESLSSFWSDIAKAEAPPPRSNFTVLRPGAVEYTTAGGQVTGIYTAPSQAQTDTLHLLARNASVNGIGIVEPDRGPPTMATVVQPSSPDPQVVHVKLHSRRTPLILVLTANSNVVWQLDTPPNALLMAVLLSGASGSTVQGQGGAQVVNIGSAYSFTYGYAPPDGHPGYADLQAEVYTYTGRHIGLFEGGLAETMFNIF